MKKRTKWFRECPKCNIVLYYSSNRNLQRAIQNNGNCNNCKVISENQKKLLSTILTGRKYPNYKRRNLIKIKVKWTRECPSCGKLIQYKGRVDAYENAIKNNACCTSCVTSKREVKWILSQDQINKMRAKKAGYDTFEEYQKALPAFQRYKKEVWRLTYKQPIESLINFEKRGRAGIEGAYQLDHKISIWKGFKENISEEKIAHISNLQMLPWLENLKKHKN